MPRKQRMLGSHRRGVSASPSSAPSFWTALRTLAAAAAEAAPYMRSCEFSPDTSCHMWRLGQMQALVLHDLLSFLESRSFLAQQTQARRLHHIHELAGTPAVHDGSGNERRVTPGGLTGVPVRAGPAQAARLLRGVLRRLMVHRAARLRLPRKVLQLGGCLVRVAFSSRASVPLPLAWKPRRLLRLLNAWACSQAPP